MKIKQTIENLKLAKKQYSTFTQEQVDKAFREAYLADSKLTPDISVVDSFYASSEIDVMTHALEAYAYVLASDFTNPLSLEAMRLTLKHLPKSVRDGEKAKLLMAAISGLKESIGIKATIAQYDVSEKEFLIKLEDGDQRIGANLRYPLMSELKEMYFRACYAAEKFKEITNLKIIKEKNTVKKAQ